MCDQCDDRPMVPAASNVTNHDPSPGGGTSRRAFLSSSAALAAVATIAALPLRAMTEASDSPVVSPMVTPGSPPALPCRPGRANPSSALRARMRISAMQALPLGIVENGTACLHRHFAAPQEIAGAQFLAHALTSAREEPKADPMAQHGRIGNRAHETLIVPGVGFRALGDEMRTVMAGYHWFTDWGRDTMISLEGLTLATNRSLEASWILRNFANAIRDGLIPNLFPERSRVGLYHTADATLWFFHAVDRYLDLPAAAHALADAVTAAAA